MANGTRTSYEDRVALLRQRFDYADAWRKQYDDRAIRYYKLYRGYRPAYDVDDPKYGRSNLHIPRTYEEIDAIRARLVKSFCSTRPFVDFIPLPGINATPQMMEQNTKKADIASSVLDMQLDKNGWTRLFYDYVTSFLIYPAGIISVGWRYDVEEILQQIPTPVWTGQFDPLTRQPVIAMTMQEQKGEKVVWDDNEIANVDFFDFWPDPRGIDIDSCRFVFHREWLSQDELEERMEVLDDAGGGAVYVPNWEEIRDSGGDTEEGRWRRMEEVEDEPETVDGVWDEDDSEETSKGRLYEVLNYWTNTQHAILVNRNTMVYDGDNPYNRHGKKPFAVTSFEPIPNEFYGMSAVEVIEPLQEELNTTRNQRIDNVSLALNRSFLLRKGADVNMEQLTSQQPGNVIEVQSIEGDLKQLTVTDVTASSYNEESIIKQDMENAIAVPAVVRGTSANRQETATEVVTKSSNASIRFDVKIMLFELSGLKRLAYLMDCNNQQFIDSPRLVKMYDQEGVDSWKIAQPDDILGEWDYRPSGSNIDPAANKEMRRQQLTQLMQVGVQMPWVNPYALFKLWLESFDLRNVNQILLTPEQMQQQQQQQMLQQLLLQNQQQSQSPPGTQPGMGR